MEPHDSAELILVVSERVQNLLVERSNSSSLSKPYLWPECIGIFRPDESHIRLEIINTDSPYQFPNVPHLLPCLITGETYSSISDNSIFGSIDVDVPFYYWPLT